MDLNNIDKEELLKVEKPLYLFELGYVEALKAVGDTIKFSNMKHFILGILAGIWIGVAFTAAFYASYALSAPSAQKILLGVVFATVLSPIFFVGGQFLTSYFFITFSVIKGSDKVMTLLRAFGFIYLGNIIGQLFFAVLWQFSSFGQDLEMNTYLYNVGVSRLFDIGKSALALSEFNTGNISVKDYAITILKCLFSAMMCGFCVTAALPASKSVKGTNDLCATIFLMSVMIFLFAISGYQHCVANWYLYILILFQAICQNDILMHGIHQHSSIMVFIYLVIFNLLPTLLGNFISAILLGWLLHLINKRMSNRYIAYNGAINDVSRSLKLQKKVEEEYLNSKKNK